MYSKYLGKREEVRVKMKICIRLSSVLIYYIDISEIFIDFNERIL